MAAVTIIDPITGDPANVVDGALETTATIVGPVIITGPVEVTQGTNPWITSGTSTVTGTVNTNLNGLTGFATTQYVVGTTPVQLTPSPLTGRSSTSIKVVTTTPSDTVFIGPLNTVTISNGYPLFNGDSVQLDLTDAQTIWAVGTSAGQLVYTLEIG